MTLKLLSIYEWIEKVLRQFIVWIALENVHSFPSCVYSIKCKTRVNKTFESFPIYILDVSRCSLREFETIQKKSEVK